jgi:hypothetical protein
MNNSEVRQIQADAAYWNELGDALGWQMYGFTAQLTASYITDSISSVQLTGSQRDDIMAAINAAREDERSANTD